MSSNFTRSTALQGNTLWALGVTQVGEGRTQNHTMRPSLGLYVFLYGSKIGKR